MQRLTSAMLPEFNYLKAVREENISSIVKFKEEKKLPYIEVIISQSDILT